MTAKIKMYGTAWCGDCRRAKQIFQSEGVEYEWIDLAEHPDAAATVEKINHGSRSVPTIIFPDGSRLTEPDTLTLGKKLDSLKQTA